MAADGGGVEAGVDTGEENDEVLRDEIRDALVVRGEDLFMATSLHRLLQVLLDLPPPCYHHHELLRDSAGRKLSKSLRAKALRALRHEGVTPARVKRQLGLVGRSFAFVS